MSIEARKAIVAGRKSFLSRNYSRFGLLVLGIVAAAVAMGQAAGEGHEEGRKLSEYAPGICDGYLYQNYFYLILALYCWAIYYMFWGLAIVCDDYFVASLEEISEALGLSPDVAGATFMAAGSSAPELFTSLMGVFAVKNDVGVGTIVGSAVFNLCCIIGGTAMFTPGVLKIDWKPITRDSIFYGISIAAMIYVLADGTVTTKEAASLMGFYVLYVLVMWKNQSMMEAIDSCTGKGAQDKDLNHEFDGKDGEDEEEESGPLAQAIVAPIAVLFEVTIPDCTKDENKEK